MVDSLQTLAKGGTSIGLMEVVNHVPSGTDTGEVIKIGLQVLIGILTLFKMWKEKRK